MAREMTEARAGAGCGTVGIVATGVFLRAACDIDLKDSAAVAKPIIAQLLNHL